MKRFVLFAIIGLVVASCSFETYQCHAYGSTNQRTKHGHKAQAKYIKRNI